MHGMTSIGLSRLDVPFRRGTTLVSINYHSHILVVLSSEVSRMPEQYDEIKNQQNAREQNSQLKIRFSTSQTP
jgi:hypothetical protein